MLCRIRLRHFEWPGDCFFFVQINLRLVLRLSRILLLYRQASCCDSNDEFLPVFILYGSRRNRECFVNPYRDFSNSKMVVRDQSRISYPVDLRCRRNTWDRNCTFHLHWLRCEERKRSDRILILVCHQGILFVRLTQYKWRVPVCFALYIVLRRYRP